MKRPGWLGRLLGRAEAPPSDWGHYTVNRRRLNHQWRAGRWAYMAGLEEVGRYSVVAGYARYFHEQPSVLDIGCGAGTLLGRLGPGGYSRYLGIDISAEAVALGSTHGFPDAEFRVARAERFETDRRFDVIVWNEVLYYLTNPLDVLQRIEAFLEPGGHFVASMVVNERTAANWTLLERRYQFLDEIVTKSARAEWSWSCRVWAPTGSPVAGSPGAT